ncbi:MAG: type II toxin-antitoxin system HicB family antitoxin [Xenococcaceae cyanobacterium]
MRYAIVISERDDRYYASIPDVPELAATGRTLEEVKKQIKETLEFYLEDLVENGQNIPESTSVCSYVEINAPTIHMCSRG